MESTTSFNLRVLELYFQDQMQTVFNCPGFNPISQWGFSSQRKGMVGTEQEDMEDTGAMEEVREAMEDMEEDMVGEVRI